MLEILSLRRIDPLEAATPEIQSFPSFLGRPFESPPPWISTDRSEKRRWSWVG